MRQAQSKPSYDQAGRKEDSIGQEGDAVYRKYLREKITNNIEEEPSVFIQVKPQSFTDPSDNIQIASNAQQQEDLQRRYFSTKPNQPRQKDEKLADEIKLKYFNVDGTKSNQQNHQPPVEVLRQSQQSDQKGTILGPTEFPSQMASPIRG